MKRLNAFRLQEDTLSDDVHSTEMILHSSCLRSFDIETNKIELAEMIELNRFYLFRSVGQETDLIDRCVGCDRNKFVRSFERCSSTYDPLGEEEEEETR